MRSIKRGLRLITLTAVGLLLSHSWVFANSSSQSAVSLAGSSTAKPAAKAAARSNAKPAIPAAGKATTKSLSKSPSRSINQAASKSASQAVKKVASKPSAKLARKARISSDPDIRSASLIVIDEEDSSILLSKNADKAAPIASITKLMTALVVLEAEQPLEEKIEITREDRAIDRGGPSRLAAGTVLSRGDLLHLALMSSENRAAYAVGRSYPGGISEMLRAMNQKAKDLGMTNARFADPTGLSSKNVASPSDLSKLVIAASRNPTIRSYSTDPEHAIAMGRSKLEFRNTNNLVRKADWDIVVQKTGYTEAAGRCLVMKTLVKDRPVVIVLLNSFGKYTRVADAARIRRWIETGHPQATTRSAMLTGTPTLTQ